MYAKDVKRKCANVHERNILYIARMWREIVIIFVTHKTMNIVYIRFKVDHLIESEISSIISFLFLFTLIKI